MRSWFWRIAGGPDPWVTRGRRSVRRTRAWIARAGVVVVAAMLLAAVVAAAPARAQAAPDAVSGGAATAQSTVTAPPAGTVLRAGRFPVDLQGRVLFVHGPSVPPGVTVDAATVRQWAAEGFSAVRLGVRLEADGTLTAVPRFVREVTGPASAPPEASLDQLADVVTALTDSGLRVMIQIVPTPAATRAGDTAFVSGLRGLSQRFRDVPGLIGFELGTQAAASSGALNGAVRDFDPHHLLWRQGPAPFDPTAGVVTNDEATLLVGWAAGDRAAAQRLVVAADSAEIGWFFDRPLNDALLAVLVRPYASAVAGLPVGITYNPAGRLLTLSYVPASPGGGALDPRATTQIRIPARIYPQGYVVRATGATIVSAPGAGVVCLVTDARAARVDVRVEPAAEQAAPVAPPLTPDPCPAGTAAGPATNPAAGIGSAPASAGNSVEPSGEEPNTVLLVVLPLGGAVGMAAILSPLVRRLRRGRARRPAEPINIFYP